LLPALPRCSLYSRAVVMGYKRAMRSQHGHTSLLKLEGVEQPEDTQFYLGKVRGCALCLLPPSDPSVVARGRCLRA
jgi:ribosomal protein L35AE/L33A